MCLTTLNLCATNKDFEVLDYDLTYIDLEFEINPYNKYIFSKAKEQFFCLSENNKLPLVVDLSNSLKVERVVSKSKNLSFIHRGNKLIIYPDDFWQKKDSVIILYNGEPRQTGLGSAVFDFHDGNPIFWTLSQPYGAMQWYPSHQVLSDKIDSSKITIHCPHEFTSLSNGKNILDTIRGGVRTKIFKNNYPIAYYLLAISITNYQKYNDLVITSNNDSINFANYVYPEKIERSKRQTSKLIPCLKMFCDSFGVYPFRDYGYSQAQFGWQGGIEHQNISFLSHFDLDLMIHELAHQWFGNLITCDSWQNIWLNEGFAFFCEGLAIEKGVGGSYDANVWRKKAIQTATENPNGRIFVDDTLKIYNIFSKDLVYNKAAMMIYMLRKEVGDRAFFDFIRQYLSNPDFRFKTCSSREFINFFNRQLGINFDWFFNQWLYSKGYPKYQITYQEHNNTVDIQLSQTSTDSSQNFFRARVPLMLCGEFGQKTFVRLNNIYNNQIFTININYKISEIIFDPYSEIITRNPIIYSGEVIVNDYSKQNKKKKTKI